MTLDDRICIVTGAARGIGLSIVRAFVDEGARVIATDVDPAVLQAAIADLPRERVLALQHDVTSESQWAATVDQAKSVFGGLDVLVNNAGIFLYSSIESMTLEQWRRMSSVNLDGVFLGTKHAIRVMKDQARRAESSASIVNLSSVAGLRGSPNLSAYCMTKGGVRLFTKAAATECGSLRIRVNSIHPGMIETEMGLTAIRERLQTAGQDLSQAQAAGAANPLGRFGGAPDVARMAVYLASEQSSFVTGTEMVVDGGLNAR